MRLMYIDESGDPGPLKPNAPAHLQPSRHYILTGLVIDATDWRNYLSAMVDIRRFLKATYGVLMRSELHGAELIHPRGNSDFRLIKKRHRLAIYRDFLASFASRMPDARLINIHVNKQNPRYQMTRTAAEYQELCWAALVQRFNTHLQKDCGNDLGLILADETNELKVRKLVRKMRVHNYVPSQFGSSRNLPINQIIEDPIMRNSANSYFVQVADLVSHALYRKLYPKGSLRKYHGQALFDLVNGCLLTAASQRDRQGIVHL